MTDSQPQCLCVFIAMGPNQRLPCAGVCQQIHGLEEVLVFLLSHDPPIVAVRDGVGYIHSTAFGVDCLPVFSGGASHNFPPRKTGDLVRDGYRDFITASHHHHLKIVECDKVIA
ncbi:Basement membrane-specific heparan sulfate proteoglycan core protein [Frankliniella fusca]|uniref:Basement membrane-specific heparan sulfate proteoglycan core protein n=1 Tax=Frankliniella fusca TaxID=407009 RepID=A0AAE1HXF4_9NEOP|nr:Basement membrane-specific heparan sulfate proteoglycan core protein [Frankliniella fusca]